MDVNWSYGSLVTPPTPKEPESLSQGDNAVAALLDEAEDIVNRAGPTILAEMEAEGVDTGSLPLDKKARKQALKARRRTLKRRSRRKKHDT